MIIHQGEEITPAPVVAGGGRLIDRLSSAVIASYSPPWPPSPSPSQASGAVARVITLPSIRMENIECQADINELAWRVRRVLEEAIERAEREAGSRCSGDGPSYEVVNCNIGCS